MQDGRCRYGLRAKREWIARRLAGETAREIARSQGCSPTTITTAWQRYEAASEAEQRSGAWALPRKPVPSSCPWQLDQEVEDRIVEARLRTNWGEMRLASLVGRHRSTVGRVLRRRGCSQRRTLIERPPTRRFEWAEPGALLHIDAFKVPKFEQPGHWATGNRSKIDRARNLGHTYVIAVLDDHSRCVYAELHSAENAKNVTATLRRALTHFTELGCVPAQAVMSDNAKCYAQSHAFARLLAEHQLDHIRIPPYTPRVNGKIERFFGTLGTEWARGRVWPNSTQRDRALASYLRFYNRRRAHSAAGGRAPITRVQHFREQDNWPPAAALRTVRRSAP